MCLMFFFSTMMLDLAWGPVSCELGLIETTEPTGGTQNREHWGGPTNGRAAACRLAVRG